MSLTRSASCCTALPAVLANHVASFLHLDDLRALLVVSKAFSRIRGQRADTAARTCTLKTNEDVTRFRDAGPWTTFVTTLVIGWYTDLNDDLAEDLLGRLTSHTPHLRELRVRHCQPAGEPRLPQSITTFEYHESWAAPASNTAVHLIRAVGSLPWLDTVRVHTKTTNNNALLPLFAPLVTSIRIVTGDVSDMLAHALQSAVALRTVELQTNTVSASLFEKPLPWTSLTLHVASLDMKVFPRAQLPALTSLDTDIDLGATQPWSSQITTLAIPTFALPNVHSCVGVVDLTLYGMIRRAKDLDAIAQLPALRSLTLCWAHGVHKLAVLHRLPHVTKLVLRGNKMELDDDCIANMHALTHLELHGDFSIHFSALQKLAFQVPSPVLPHLRVMISSSHHVDF